LLDSYGGRFTVAEVGGDDSDREMKLFTSGNRRLNSAYSFDFLYAQELTPTLVSNSLACWPDRPGLGWPSWAFENHDAPRAISRWSVPGHERAFAAIKMLLLVCLRGNIFLYQGEELGLPQVELAFHDLQDPEAITNWPMTLSRDGARTPMPWRADAPSLGFSEARPWLPVGAAHTPLAVDRQEADPSSPLALTRRLLALRNGSEVLRLGDLEMIHADDRLLAFERHHEGRTLLCCFNLSPDPASWAAPYARRPIESVGQVEDDQLGAYAGYVAEKEA
jgi:alpha-glucosidase